MDKDQFWQLIDKSREGTADCETQTEKLTELLLGLEPSEIASFDWHFEDCIAAAYRWDLWAVIYIMNGGASDDTFEYFMRWLISQGRSYFESALQNPERAADRLEPDAVAEGGAECEEIAYAAYEAYEQKTGQDLPCEGYPLRTGPHGPTWNEDELKTLYPRLWQKYMVAD